MSVLFAGGLQHNPPLTHAEVLFGRSHNRRQRRQGGNVAPILLSVAVAVGIIGGAFWLVRSGEREYQRIAAERAAAQQASVQRTQAPPTGSGEIDVKTGRVYDPNNLPAPR